MNDKLYMNITTGQVDTIQNMARDVDEYEWREGGYESAEELIEDEIYAGKILPVEDEA